MNAFCPNLSNPQVKQEFEELVQAVGEDAAYFLWNKIMDIAQRVPQMGLPQGFLKTLWTITQVIGRKPFRRKEKRIYSNLKTLTLPKTSSTKTKNLQYRV